MKLSNNTGFSEKQGKKKNVRFRQFVAMMLIVAFATCSLNGDLRASSEGPQHEGTSVEMQTDGTEAETEAEDDGGEPADTQAPAANEDALPGETAAQPEDGAAQEAVAVTDEAALAQDEASQSQNPANVPENTENSVQPSEGIGESPAEIAELGTQDDPADDMKDKVESSAEIVAPDPYEEDYNGLMSEEELEELPEEEAGATMWEDGSALAPVTISAVDPVAAAPARERAMFRADTRAVEALEPSDPADVQGQEQDSSEAPEEPAGPSGDDAQHPVQQDNWSFNIRYVAAGADKDVTITQNSSLKYQMSFHAGNRQYQPGEVVIRIPAKLVNNRSGAAIYPKDNDIAVPKVESPFDRDKTKLNEQNVELLEGSIENRSTPFNYYIENNSNGEQELVFVNYKPIAQSGNCAWQVLYKNLELMDIVDQSEWALQASIKVSKRTVTKITEPDPENPDGPGKEKIEISWDDSAEPVMSDVLTGRIDSSVQLTTAVKRAFTEQGKSYTPGLYTEGQIKNYLPNGYVLPEGLNTNDYRFVVWDVRVAGSANQHWNLILEDNTTAGTGKGFVVGYKNHPSTEPNQLAFPESAISALPSGDTGELDVYPAVANGTKENFFYRFYVVTAYPESAAQPGAEIKNDLKVMLQGTDGDAKDSLAKDTGDTWTYTNYHWVFKGDIFSIRHETPEQDGRRGKQGLYDGWLEVLKQGGESYGDIPFYTTGTMKGYQSTHYTDSNHPGSMGAYIEGTSYELTTTDDLLYVHEVSGFNDKRDAYILGKDDYYYSSIDITQTDYGYNIWEDARDQVEFIPDSDVDKKVEVWAMFAKAENGDDLESPEWEKVDTLDMPTEGSSKGSVTYHFEEDQIKREPFHVKVVRRTINYETVCNIDVKVRVKNSSTIRGIIQAYDEEEHEKTGTTLSLQLGSAAGVYGKYWSENNTKSVDAYYSAPQTGADDYDSYVQGGLDIRDKTNDLHGGLIFRNNARAKVTGLEGVANAYKTSTSTNDPEHSRVLLNYKLTAYDGYGIYSQEALDYLRSNENVEGLLSPGRNKVVFYDLLPYGVNFDPSYKVTAGRITNLSISSTGSDFRTNTSRWSDTQVTVKVDSTKTVENFNQTGRTLIVFEITYDGADSTEYTAGKWAEGWAVDFRAYYDWKDIYMVQKEANVSAFMTSPEDPKYLEPLRGPGGVVMPDDGKSFPSSMQSSLTKLFDGLEGGLDGDPRNDTFPSVLYAERFSKDSVAQAFQDQILKTVRADRDLYGAYTESAVVEPEKGYTYELTMSTADTDKTNIIIYDNLEQFSTNKWYGTLDSVITTGLEAMGFSPTVYYFIGGNKETGARVYPEFTVTDPGYTDENGTVIRAAVKGEKPDMTDSRWVEASEYKEDKAKITAIAVALGNGILKGEGMNSVSVQVKMKAPKMKEEEGQEGYRPDALSNFTRNRAYTYSETAVDGVGDSTTGVVSDSNYTKVCVSKYQIYELTKAFDESVPDAAKNDSFRFQLRYSYGQEDVADKVLAFQEYVLLDKEGNAKTDKMYSTDANGCLTLHEGEVARFANMPLIEKIAYRELTLEENLFWEERGSKKAESTESKTENGKETEIKKLRVTVTNGYRPALYLQKKIEGVPSGSSDAKDSYFVFQVQKSSNLMSRLFDNYEYLTNSDYYYVDSIPVNGNLPLILKDADGNAKKGTTDSEGRLKIKEGDIIVLFPGDEKTEYQVDEIGVAASADSIEPVESVDTNWICENPTHKGTLGVNGQFVSVTNFYKWKELVITKEITHQDIADCTVPFTFSIVREENDAPLANAKWHLVNPDGKDLSPTQKAELDGMNPPRPYEGTTGADGKFTSYCAGYKIIVEGLEAQTGYIVAEVEVDEDYRPENDSQQVAVSQRGTSVSVKITNDYLYRPLSVTKTVLYDPVKGEDPGDRAFSMLVTVDGKPIAAPYNKYSIIENGKEIGSNLEAENGVITLTNGQTAKFKYAGKLGQEFEVAEYYDLEYPQLVPEDHENHDDGDNKLCTPYTGGFTGNSQTATIVNGVQGFLMLRKEYEAADGDQAAADMLEDFKSYRKGETSSYELKDYFDSKLEQFKVKFTLTVTDETGRTYQWPETNADVRVLDANGNLEEEPIPWNAGEPLEIEPWRTVLVPLGGDCHYELEEAEEDQQKIIPAVQNALSLLGDNDTGTSDTVLAKADESGQKGLDVYDDSHAGRSGVITVALAGQSVQGVLSPDGSSDAQTVQSDRKNGMVVTRPGSTGGESQEMPAYTAMTWEISQKNPANFDKLAGDVKTNPLAVITNQVKGYSLNTHVGKAMAFGSNPVPTGAKLVWRVQKYSKGVDDAKGEWVNADDVPYLVSDGNGLLEQKVRFTEDGLITLYKTENGYPSVALGERVFINLYDQEAIDAWLQGDKTKDMPLYRIVEVTDLSDYEDWGMLAGYIGGIENLSAAEGEIRDTDTAEEIENTPSAESRIRTNSTKKLSVGDKINNSGDDAAGSETSVKTYAGYTTEHRPYYGLDMKASIGGAFVNSNRLTEVEVAKELAEGSSSDRFAIVLRQVISTKTDASGTEDGDDMSSKPPKAVTKESEILASETRNNVLYRVYDGNGQVGGDNWTKDGGRIYLKAGQYAKVYLPDQTLWTMHEDMAQSLNYNLVELTPTIEQPVKGMTRLQDDNGKEVDKVLVNQRAAEYRELVVLDDLNIATEMLNFSKNDILQQAGNAMLAQAGQAQTASPKLRMTVQDNMDGASLFAGSVMKEGDIRVGILSSISGITQLKPEQYKTIMTGPDTAALEGRAKELIENGANETPTRQDITHMFEAEGEYTFAFTYTDDEGTLTTQTKRQVKMAKGIVIYQYPVQEREYYYYDEVTQSYEPYDWHKQNGAESITIEIPEYVYMDQNNGSGSPQYVRHKVIGIGNSAFSNREDIKSVTLPATIQSIDQYAFYNCTGLEEVTIAKNSELTEIKERAFENCTSLKSVNDGRWGNKDYSTFSANLERIGDSAFKNCHLIYLQLPSSLKTIGDSAFEVPDEGTASLEIVDNAGGLQKIGQSAFKNNTMLYGAGILSSPNLKEIGMYAFSHCTNLKQVEISASVKTIGHRAFENCEKLWQVRNLENSAITSVSSYTFYHCTSLKDIKLPNTVTRIESQAFEGTGLEKIELPNRVKRIDFGVFNSCKNLKTIIVPADLTYIGGQAFCGDEKLAEMRVRNESGDLTEAGVLTIPETVTEIGSSAFKRCSSEIPGDDGNYTGIAEVDIRSHNPKIGNEAFGICKALTKVRLHRSVTFSENCFEECGDFQFEYYE